MTSRREEVQEIIEKSKEQPVALIFERHNLDWPIVEELSTQIVEQNKMNPYGADPAAAVGFGIAVGLAIAEKGTDK